MKERLIVAGFCVGFIVLLFGAIALGIATDWPGIRWLFEEGPLVQLISGETIEPYPSEESTAIVWGEPTDEMYAWALAVERENAWADVVAVRSKDETLVVIIAPPKDWTLDETAYSALGTLQEDLNNLVKDEIAIIMLYVVEHEDHYHAVGGTYCMIENGHLMVDTCEWGELEGTFATADLPWIGR